MSDWIKHVKDYQSKHPKLSYGEAMKAAKSSYKKVSKKQKGGKSIVETVKDKIKDVLFFPPNQLPAPSRKVFNKFKGLFVEKITIRREPISSYIDKALNVLSLGKWSKVKEDAGYDKMFHLSMVVKLRGIDKPISIEKIARVNINEDADKTLTDKEKVELFPLTNYKATLKDGIITLDEMLENTRKKIGDHEFFQYNALEGINCQNFIKNILSANNLLTPQAEKFLFQPMEDILKGLPWYIPKISQALTDARGKLEQIQGGEGSNGKDGKDGKWLLHAVLFDNKAFDKKDAEKWLKEHKYKAIYEEDTENKHRYRIRRKIKGAIYMTKQSNDKKIDLVFMKRK